MKPEGASHEEKLKQAERVAYLVAGHLQGRLTHTEAAELDAWINESDANLELFENLTDENQLEAGLQQYLRTENLKAEEAEALLARIRENKKRSRRMRPGVWLVAASVVVLAAAGFFLLLYNKPHEPVAAVAPAVVPGEIGPGTDKAVLTLGDGRTVILEPERKGVVTSEGAVSIRQEGGGTIRYEGGGAEGRENTIATPRGGRYAVVLGDGTKVWLNAESRLRYPAGMARGPREVALWGEAYFEVAKDAARPFTVHVQTPEGEGGKVQVLGTHFNVHAYGDAGPVKTTLVEGLVKIELKGVSKLLRPGEEARLIDDIPIRTVDAAEAVAWTEGRFLFRDETIREIGAQLERWYDVEVAYRGPVTPHFNLEISREIPLRRLLAALEKTGQVHFQLNGKQLLIQP